ncbi:hypothetical protein CC78DRAFT_578784 [Lojkania enalia]|uniref:Uncharacterized protein n=1 Tax=Lojkania enalia TaxID=147567 RepID=A0A9P4N4M8_9PLEO|nr:hypothetical protein CC78DRAFT_578784 [Didymosphaeria enalia]
MSPDSPPRRRSVDAPQPRTRTTLAWPAHETHSPLSKKAKLASSPFPQIRTRLCGERRPVKNMLSQQEFGNILLARLCVFVDECVCMYSTSPNTATCRIAPPPSTLRNSAAINVPSPCCGTHAVLSFQNSDPSTFPTFLQHPAVDNANHVVQKVNMARYAPVPCAAAERRFDSINAVPPESSEQASQKPRKLETRHACPIPTTA